MSIFSIPIVADTVARLMNRGSYAYTSPELRFDEITGLKSEISIPTRHGPVRCIRYLPSGEEGRPAVYVNFHGGGFAFRDPEQDDPFCRYLAARAGVVVLNVDYDVAPKHRFPVPVEEAYDIAAWASGAAQAWDGSRLCVGGQSAGGNLATAVARLSLERGGPPIALQVMHYAALDLASAEKKRPPGSGIQLVPRWVGKVFAKAYIPDPRQRRHPLASPAWGNNAAGLEGIAPALVITAEHDTLHEEGASYAEALRRAGALREHLVIPGAGHAYNIVGGTRAQAEQAYATIVRHVREATGTAPPA